ncbi:MAG: hypothetical protein WC761_01630 [Candidatus Paceibacterota bacterium]|jgi:hypothetical protein
MTIRSTYPYSPLNEREIEVWDEGDVCYYDGPIVEYKIIRYKNAITMDGEPDDCKLRFELSYVMREDFIDENMRMSVRWTKQELQAMIDDIEKVERNHEQEKQRASSDPTRNFTK